MNAIIIYFKELPIINLVLGIPIVILALVCWSIMIIRWIRNPEKR